MQTLSYFRLGTHFQNALTERNQRQNVTKKFLISLITYYDLKDNYSNPSAKIIFTVLLGVIANIQIPSLGSPNIAD